MPNTEIANPRWWWYCRSCPKEAFLEVGYMPDIYEICKEPYVHAWTIMGVADMDHPPKTVHISTKEDFQEFLDTGDVQPWN